MGTPSYMAPEQADGRVKEIGPLSDVYALGAILYELLAGRPPSREPVSPRDLNPAVPRELETVCLKCLQKEPGKRYASARELADDLGRFLEDRPIRARPAGLGERLLKYTRRNKLLVGSATAIFLTLLVGIITTTAKAREARQQNANYRREQRERFAESARSALARGDLRSALENAAQAIEAGFHDPVEMRLIRVRCLFALAKTDEAKQALEQVRSGGGLGKHEGTVLLLTGDLARERDNEEALKYFRQALDKGLSDIDEAYAKGMLSEKSDDAIRYFRQALKYKGYDEDARRMLGISLILRGMLEEAWDVAVGGATRYPHDPTFVFFQAIIVALKGDVKRSHALIDELGEQIDKDMLGPIKSGMSTLASFQEFEGLLDPDAEKRMATAWLELAPFATRFFGPVVQTDKDPLGRKTAQRWLEVPPSVHRSFSKVLDMVKSLLLQQPRDLLLVELDQMIRAHPEGTFIYFKGVMLLGQQRYEEAEAAFLLALRTPSFIPLKRGTLLAAIFCEGMLLRQKPEDREVRKRAVENIQSLRRQKPVRPFDADTLAAVARGLLADWEAQVGPADLALLRRRAQVELVAGNPVIALQTANKLLQVQPDDTVGRQVRAAATANLRALVGMLPP
jgi:tetratricopeptide (TPR) repeat protein